MLCHMESIHFLRVQDKWVKLSIVLVLSMMTLENPSPVSSMKSCPAPHLTINGTCVTCDEYCDNINIGALKGLILPPSCFNTTCKTAIDAVVLNVSNCPKGYIHELQLGICERCELICPYYKYNGLQYLCDNKCANITSVTVPASQCAYGYYREKYEQGLSECRSCHELCTTIKDEPLFLQTDECHTIGNCTKWLEQIMYKKVSRQNCDKDKIYDTITEECRLCENVCGMNIEIGMKTICDETCQITSLIDDIKLSTTSKPTSNSSISSGLTKIVLISVLVPLSALILILIIICCVKRFCYRRLKCFNRRKFYESSDKNTSSTGDYHFSNESRHVLPNDKTSDKSNTKDRTERKQKALKQQTTDSENHSLIRQDTQENDQMHVEKCVRDIDNHDRSNKDIQGEQNDLQVTLGSQAKTNDSRSASNLMQSNEDNTPVQSLSYDKIEDSKAQNIGVPTCYVSETPIEMDLFPAEDDIPNSPHHDTRTDDNRNRDTTDRVKAAEAKIPNCTRNVVPNLDHAVETLRCHSWFKYIDFEDEKLIIVYEGLSEQLAIQKVQQETGLSANDFSVRQMTHLLDSVEYRPTDNYNTMAYSVGDASLFQSEQPRSFAYTSVQSSVPSVYNFVETIYNQEELNKVNQDENKDGPHIKGPEEHGHETAGEIEHLRTDMSDIPDVQGKLQALAAEQWVKRLVSNGRFVRVWYDALDPINARRLVGQRLGVDNKHFDIEYAYGQRR